MGVAAALLGAGIWSLVAQQLVVGVVGLILLWIVGSWRPRFRFSTSHARELLGFSLQVFAGNLGTWLTRRADVVLMGIFFGPVTVGLYRLGDRMVDALLDARVASREACTRFRTSRVSRAIPTGCAGRRAPCVRLGSIATVPLMLIMAACANQLTGGARPALGDGDDHAPAARDRRDHEGADRLRGGGALRGRPAAHARGGHLVARDRQRRHVRRGRLRAPRLDDAPRDRVDGDVAGPALRRDLHAGEPDRDRARHRKPRATARAAS